MAEIIQVGEVGNILGPIPYSEAHPADKNQPGIRHITVNGLIYKDKSKQEFLCQQRGKNVQAGKYNLDISFGGHVFWETYERNKRNLKNTVDSTVESTVRDELFSGDNLPPELKLGLLWKGPKQTKPSDPEYVFLYEGIYPGPFNPNRTSGQVINVRFRSVDEVLTDMEENPTRYTRTLGFHLRRIRGSE